MPVQQTFIDGVTKTMNIVHRAALRATGGRVGTKVFGMPAVELHTVGRKSGQRRSVMLTAPIQEPDRVVLVASKGGDDRHPDWYRNLVANPNVNVEVDDETYEAIAETVTGPERDAIYAKQAALRPNFGDYQRNTTRIIPVVALRRG